MFIVHAHHITSGLITSPHMGLPQARALAQVHEGNPAVTHVCVVAA